MSEQTISATVPPVVAGIEYTETREVHLSREWRRLLAELQALRNSGVETVILNGLSGAGAMTVTAGAGVKVIEP